MGILAPNCVLVSESELTTFADSWPCSGLPRWGGLCVAFSYDSNGLCDIQWFTDEGIDAQEPEGIDGAAMVALSDDAHVFLKQQK